MIARRAAVELDQKKLGEWRDYDEDRKARQKKSS